MHSHADMGHDAVVLLDEEMLRATLAAHVDEAEARSLLAAARVSARLTLLQPDARPDAVLGGTPVLPDAMGWPAFEGERLDFLAAVSLRAVHRELHRAPVPETGTLLFFANASLYAPSGLPIGSHDPSTNGSWAVLPADLDPVDLVPATTGASTGGFRPASTASRRSSPSPTVARTRTTTILWTWIAGRRWRTPWANRHKATRTGQNIA